jgi:hypothetical protein
MHTVPLSPDARWRVWGAIAATAIVVCLNAVLAHI